MEAICLQLRGRLSEDSLREAFRDIQGLVDRPGPPVQLIVDCREMESYELDARTAFVDWNKLNKQRVSAVAVVTTNKLWHVVVATMALISGQKLSAFSDLADAQLWCATAAAKLPEAGVDD